MKYHFFSAGYSEKKSVLIFMIVLVGMYLFWFFFFQPEKEMKAEDIEAINELNEKLTALSEAEIKDTIFDFNPNTIPEEKLKLLNLNPVVITNWLKKREKYPFREPCDVLWVKGLSKYDFLRLQGNMVFQNSEPKREKVFYAEKENKEPVFRHKVKQQTEPFNLNTITEEKLNALGIRDFIALRLVKFRDKLGGFYSTEQLKDIFGIKEFELEKLSAGYIQQDDLQKRDFSTQSFKDVLSHPYINYELCKRIFNLKDSLKTEQFSDLKENLPPDSYKKIAPYFY